MCVQKLQVHSELSMNKLTIFDFGFPSGGESLCNQIMLCWCFADVLLVLYILSPSGLCLPAAMLVLAELHDVAGYVSQLQVGVAVVPEVLQ